MTAPTAPTAATPVTAGGRARSAWPWVAVAGAVLALVIVAGNPRSKGPPLDPSATSPQGAKALRLLLEAEQAHVDLSGNVPPSTAGTALVLRDQLDAGRRAALLAWVNGGGTLVVADPTSELAGAALARAPGAGGFLQPEGPLSPGCAEPALAGIDRIDATGGGLFHIPAGSEGCFPSGDTAYLIVRPQGAGTVVALAGPDLWTNAQLGKLDNSVLAAGLLAPRAGTSVTWLNGTLAGGGRRSLTDLVPDRVIEGLAEVVIAFVLLALWRGRRLGRPVLESQPVELPGSELVVAVGNLLHQGHRIDQAAGILRADLARTVADRLGVGAGAPPAVLCEVTAARTGMDATVVAAILAGPLPADEAGLVALAQGADAMRQEVANAR